MEIEVPKNGLNLMGPWFNISYCMYPQCMNVKVSYTLSILKSVITLIYCPGISPWLEFNNLQDTSDMTLGIEWSSPISSETLSNVQTITECILKEIPSSFKSIRLFYKAHNIKSLEAFNMFNWKDIDESLASKDISTVSVIELHIEHKSTDHIPQMKSAKNHISQGMHLCREKKKLRINIV